MKYKAFIGIGSNIGSSGENCIEAINLLHAPPEIEVVNKSSLYESEPVGIVGQSWFINAAVEIATTLKPEKLLKKLLKIEKMMGRERREKWGPRIIDLDLLIYEDHSCNSEFIKLPHPELPNRRFVLIPLSEFAGNHIHPVIGKTIQQLLQETPDTSQVRAKPTLL